MSRRLVDPASPPALVRALGAVPVELRVGGQLVPVDEHSAVSIRRSRGVRAPLGEPASCSVTVNVATPPTWERGDTVTVRLSDAALAAVYGPEFLGSNYATNPSFEVNTAGWVALGANVTLTRTTASHWYGVAAGRVAFTAAKAANVAVLETDSLAVGVAAPGQRWSARVSLSELGTQAGGLFTLQLVAVSAVGADLAVVAQATAAIPSGGGWADFGVGSTVVAPAGTAGVKFRVRTADEFVSGNSFDLDGLVVDQLPAAPTAYVDGAQLATVDGLGRSIAYRWDGAAHASTSRKFVVGVPEATAEARYRFVGRLSDFKLRTGRSGPATAQLVAVGSTASAARTDVGDTPWAAETVVTRAARILGLVNASDPTVAVRTITSTPGPTLAPRDVDSQPAAKLLEELAPAIDPRAGLVERRDGSLVFGYISSAEFTAVDLPAEAVAQGLDHELAPIVNDVTVDMGVPVEGEVILTNLVTNPSFEVDTAGWVAGNTTIARDATIPMHGTASLKVTQTAGTNNPNAYTVIPVTPGASYRVRAMLFPQIAGNWRVQLSWYTAGNVLISDAYAPSAAGVAVGAAANYEFDAVLGPAPATAATARLYVVRVVTGGTAQVWNIDRVSAVRTDLVPAAATAAYFDGSTAAGTYDYAWTGTANASSSVAKANRDTGSQLVRVKDAASVTANGPQPSKVEAPVDRPYTATALAYGQARGAAELLTAGGWQLPPATVDLLPLLDGRVAAVTATPTATTPLELVRRLLRAELGSARRLYFPGGTTPAHVPALNAVVGHITVLDETITPHRWVIETESEKLT